MQLVSHEAKISSKLLPQSLSLSPSSWLRISKLPSKGKKNLCLWSQTVPRIPLENGAEADSLETYWWKPGNKAGSSHIGGVPMQEDMSRGNLSGDPDPAVSWGFPALLGPAGCGHRVPFLLLNPCPGWLCPLKQPALAALAAGWAGSGYFSDGLLQPQWTPILTWSHLNGNPVLQSSSDW